MGGALLQSWLDRGFPSDYICVVDPVLPADAYPVTVVNDVTDIPKNFQPHIIVVAVKPQIASEVLPSYQDYLRNGATLLSIMAGQTLETLARETDTNIAIVRAMPNLPAQIGKGITVAIANSHVSDTHNAIITSLLETVGTVHWIDDETHMDAVTALSGSGPAYVFHFIECLIQAGESLGLSAELAHNLAYHTVLGSAELAAHSDLSATEWREQVTSPNGTTQAALEILMAKDNNLYDLLFQAMTAASKRSKQLSD